METYGKVTAVWTTWPDTNFTFHIISDILSIVLNFFVPHLFSMICSGTFEFPGTSISKSFLLDFPSSHLLSALWNSHYFELPVCFVSLRVLHEDYRVQPYRY